VTIEHLESQDFDRLSQEALADPTLRRALSSATGTIAGRRAAAIEQMPDWEALREEARRIKAEALANLDTYLIELTEKAEARGVSVHWARTAAEARQIVQDLAEQVGAKTIVKSKSMTTEEIGLNHALEQAGLEPIETDLGEWIIQLAGETPSHIIVPAIHKTREQIGELFTDKLSVARTDDPGELTDIARELLRAEFAKAGLGISGVNFAIAETGSFHVLENEGNARMSTSLPRVHLAVMGIEKVIPKLRDLEVFWRLLPRSGTGQHITSYQSIFTGVKDSADEEGPQEVHLLLLDNGRTSILGDDVRRQSLACIRCGACLNTCPVYKEIGGHAYGSVYPGPIGAVITPQLAGIEKAEKLPFASSLCGACREVCPVKIDLPRLLLELRAQVVRGEKGATADAPPAPRPLTERLAFRAWRWFHVGVRRYAFSAWALRTFQPAATRSGLYGRLARRFAPALAKWTAGRELRPAPKRSFRARWGELEEERQA